MAGLPRIDPADGVVDGVNRTFSVPFPYVAGTLVVMLNGRQLDGSLDNGWTELDPGAGTFELNEAPRSPQGSPDDPGDLVSAYYENAAEGAGGGLEGGVPEITAGTDLRPKICVADDLAPGLGAEGEGCEPVPGLGAEVVRPKVCAGSELRPYIAKAEEV